MPVLANGNIRHLGDVDACLAYTGCDGVLSAEGLLADPALFAPRREPVASGDVSEGMHGWVGGWVGAWVLAGVGGRDGGSEGEGRYAAGLG